MNRAPSLRNGNELRRPGAVMGRQTSGITDTGNFPRVRRTCRSIPFPCVTVFLISWVATSRVL